MIVNWLERSVFDEKKLCNIECNIMCGCKRQLWTTALYKLDLKIQTLWDVTVCFGVCGPEISKRKCPNLLWFSGKRGI